MKRILFLLFAFLFIGLLHSNAQTYRQNKKVYDYKNFTPQLGDAFKPQIAYVGSAVLPGVGQMIAGENKRGMVFFGAFATGYYLNRRGISLQESSNGLSGEGSQFLGNTVMLATWIWAVIDAGRVAKVNSMYLRDRKNATGLNIEIAPTIFEGNKLNPRHTFGVELALTF